MAARKPATEGSIRWYRERCAFLRGEILDERLATPQEIAAYWPGGEENQHGSEWRRWDFCKENLFRFWGRLEIKESSQTRERRERLMMLAAREVPVIVDLDPDADGPRTIAVYPKSYDAIVRIDEFDAFTAGLLQGISTLDLSKPTNYEVKAKALREVRLNHLTMCWIATYPGRGAPFPDGFLPEFFPANVTALTPVDVVRVMLGYHEANGKRFAAITAGVHSDGRLTQRPSWATLAASAARQNNEPIERLLRDRSLGAWLMQLVASQPAPAAEEI